MKSRIKGLRRRDPALALDEDAQAMQGIGMTDGRGRPWANLGSPGSRARCLRTWTGVHPMGPSAFSYSVGVPEEGSYAAQYPARTFPCQRFDVGVAGVSA